MEGEAAARAVGIQVSRSPNFIAEAAKVKEYLRPFRDSNVGDPLPASLVAVLGGHSEMLALLRELLQTGLKQPPDDFLAMLLEEQGEDLAREIRSVYFTIEIVHGDTTEAVGITGNRLMVALTPDVNTLIVGDPGDLWFTYYYRDVKWHRIRLRWIQNPNQLSDAVAVFASTVETVLLKAHCNSLPGLCPKNVKDRLSKVADAGQTDLRRSQIYLLDVAEARLKELGVKGQPNFENVLKTFEQARQMRVNAELLEDGNPTLARKRENDAKELTDSAKSELINILESDADGSTRNMLVDAVRRKMTDFQYNIASIPFELFQNADDAVAELNEMQEGIDTDQQRFVLRLDSENKILEIIHWGRAINQHQYPGFSEGYQRGYDQDLQKMLTLNFSDKGIGTMNPALVTGRFGLGFKSAFFIAGQPEIVSGRLALEIRSAFYPVPLSPEKSKELRESAATRHGKPELVPTVIRLRWIEEAKTDGIAASVEAFTKVSPLLTVFSRGIRTIVVTDGANSTSWVNVQRT